MISLSDTPSAEDKVAGISGVQQADCSSYHTNYGAHKEGISSQEVTAYYNNWAESGTYEQDLCQGRYNGPQYAADNIERYCAGIKSRGRVLDMAAGTGFVGEKLAQKGFQNIDALDPAQAMLNIANRKGIYQNLICDSLGPHQTSIQDDTYDAAVLSGGMGEGHTPCSALKEMIRIVKPGGIVCLVMRQEYLSYVAEYINQLEPMMERHEQQGLWKQEERTVVASYSFNKNGIVFVYRVLVQGNARDEVSECTLQKDN